MEKHLKTTISNLLCSLLLLLSAGHLCAAASDGDIRRLMIEESINAYSGNCPCPYNSTRNGSSCGGRSAYSRPGGESPLCYPGDISAEEVAVWRQANGMLAAAVHLKKKPAKEVVDNTLPQGSFSSIYRREDWKHWIDADNDCQDTRTEVLIIESKVTATLNGGHCSVKFGEWMDPYSGSRYLDPSLLDIDHIVPLKWANGHGGDKWSKQKKKEFANDFKNLRAVGAGVNRQKGDKGPYEWMPPNQVFRCQYLNEFTSVVANYGLKWAPAEKRLVDKMHEACTKS